MTQNNQQPSEADKLFESMRTINPVRDDIGGEEAPSEGGGGSDEDQSLEERLESGRKPTDLQIADKRLFPDLAGVKHLNVQQMSRVFPDVYNPLFRIQVKDLIKNTGMSVAEAIAYVNTSLSIAIDGEGRLDLIAVAKNGNVQTEDEKNKGLI